MLISEVFSSRFLAASDTKSPTIVTIESVTRGTFSNNGEAAKEKPVVSFVGMKKPAVLNKINSTRLKDAWGDDTDGWIGKKATIQSESVSYGSKIVPGLRIYPLPEPVAKPPEFEDRIPF